MSVKKIHLFPSEESYVANSGSVEADDLALVPLNLSFDNLSDKPEAYVTETWHSGTSWYRVWSDGLIEQWGLLNGGGGGGTVTFPKRFSNTKYIFVVTPNEEGTTGQWFGWSTSNKTTSSITSYIVGGGSDGAPKQSWYAAGF